jgi:hypothetical protein
MANWWNGSLGALLKRYPNNCRAASSAMAIGRALGKLLLLADEPTGTRRGDRG